MDESYGEYRTESGENYFGFRYQQQPDGEVRAYIEDQPSYEDRPTDGHSTHRYTDEDGDPYICFDPPPAALEDAIEVSKAWAEATERYIEDGKEF